MCVCSKKYICTFILNKWQVFGQRARLWKEALRGFASEVTEKAALVLIPAGRCLHQNGSCDVRPFILPTTQSLTSLLFVEVKINEATRQANRPCKKRTIFSSVVLQGLRKWVLLAMSGCLQAPIQDFGEGALTLSRLEFQARVGWGQNAIAKFAWGCRPPRLSLSSHFKRGAGGGGGGRYGCGMSSAKLISIGVAYYWSSVPVKMQNTEKETGTRISVEALRPCSTKWVGIL